MCDLQSINRLLIASAARVKNFSKATKTKLLVSPNEMHTIYVTLDQSRSSPASNEKATVVLLCSAVSVVVSPLDTEWLLQEMVMMRPPVLQRTDMSGRLLRKLYV